MRASAGPERHLAVARRRRPRISRVFAGAWLAALGSFLLATALARFAAAQAGPPISVEREPGAEDCPDTAGLVARVEAIIGHGSSAEVTPYRVTFSRSAQAFGAAIRSGSDGATVRYLDAREPSCAALAHATALALAVLFDADLGSAGETKPAPAPAPPPPAAPAAPPAATKPAAKGDRADTAAERKSSRSVRLDPLFSVGAAALVGVLRPVVPALVADAGIEVENFRGSVGALWVPPQTIELPPGSARERLISGTVRACYAVSSSSVVRFDLCSGALVGAATAEARGFTTAERHSEFFLAFPAELAISARSRFVAWQLGASALLVYRPNEFEIEGRGLTYHPKAVAGLLALRIFFEPLR